MKSSFHLEDFASAVMDMPFHLELLRDNELRSECIILDAKGAIPKVDFKPRRATKSVAVHTYALY